MASAAVDTICGGATKRGTAAPYNAAHQVAPELRDARRFSTYWRPAEAPVHMVVLMHRAFVSVVEP